MIFDIDRVDAKSGNLEKSYLFHGSLEKSGKVWKFFENEFNSLEKSGKFF